MKLELKNINKYYPNMKHKNAMHALVDVSLELTEGIYGLTGQNGAGKSTLMQILTGYLQADTGQILWDDQEISTRSASYKQLLGYMPQQQRIYDTQTCAQFLDYFGAMKGIPAKERRRQIDALLEEVHLSDKKKVRIGTLSGGMKQRLLFAQALLGNPRLLLLDEPTAGVDPDERVNLQELIRTNSEGRIVLLSTHILSDLEDLAKEEIHLDHGHLCNTAETQV